MAKIYIAADIVPTKSNEKLFVEKNRQGLIGGEICGLFDRADFIIMNLEIPLTDHASPIPKNGPNLIAGSETVHGLQAINPCFYTLANNHILDQGEAGLESTIRLLEERGIKYSGAGKNISDAAEPFAVSIENKTIGIYCCAEHGFSIAGEDSPGANPFDPLVSFDHVRDLKSRCDYGIVLYHGGKEHYRYPSPQLQRIFHKFADSGADLVVAQHTHYIGCQEDYGQARLIYGQGNFLFDGSDSEYWQTSLLIELCLDREISVSYIPLVKRENKVRMAAEPERTAILDAFDARSKQITEKGFVSENYQRYAKSALNGYLNRMGGRFSRALPVRALNRITKRKLTDKLYNRQDRLAIQNFLDCEAHRELLAEGLKSENKA